MNETRRELLLCFVDGRKETFPSAKKHGMRREAGATLNCCTSFALGLIAHAGTAVREIDSLPSWYANQALVWLVYTSKEGCLFMSPPRGRRTRENNPRERANSTEALCLCLLNDALLIHS